MHRVYNFNGQLIFTENSNSPIGKAIGVILEIDDGKWAFFARTSEPFNLEVMEAIVDKLKSLHTTPVANAEDSQLTFNTDGF